MPQKEVVSIKINHEIDRYFDDSSLSFGENPGIVILMGAPACGMTTIRKQRYATGYVLVDATEIFISRSRGQAIPFPGTLRNPYKSLAPWWRVVRSQKDATSLPNSGAEAEPLEILTTAMNAIRYRVDLLIEECDACLSFGSSLVMNIRNGPM